MDFGNSLGAGHHSRSLSAGHHSRSLSAGHHSRSLSAGHHSRSLSGSSIPIPQAHGGSQKEGFPGTKGFPRSQPSCPLHNRGPNWEEPNPSEENAMRTTLGTDGIGAPLEQKMIEGLFFWFPFYVWTLSGIYFDLLTFFWKGFVFPFFVK
jgi:hypothetical protein